MTTPNEPPARWQDMPVRKHYPVAPKTQAAGYGAGTGALISALAVSLVQTYWTHKALPAATVQAIYAIVPIVLAFTAAYFAPHQPRPADTPVTPAVTPAAADAALEQALRRRFGRSRDIAPLPDQPAAGRLTTGGPIPSFPPSAAPPPSSAPPAPEA